MYTLLKGDGGFYTYHYSYAYPMSILCVSMYELCNTYAYPCKAAFAGVLFIEQYTQA